MTVSYDPSAKKWTFTKQEELPLNTVTYPPTKNYLNISWKTVVSGEDTYKKPTSVSISTVPVGNTVTRTPGYKNQGYTTTGTNSIELPDASSRENILKIKDEFYYEMPDFQDTDTYRALQDFGASALAQFDAAQTNEQINNGVIVPHNKQVAEYNAKLPTAQAIINSTNGYDYVSQRKALKDLGISGIEDNFKTFYLTEKLTPWSTELAAKPQYGDFDPAYYKKQNPALEQKYKEAVANDDVDVINRYSEDTFYLWHYTTQGKQAGQRGNAPEETEAATRYVEEKLTEKDLQDVRNLQLGVDMATSDARLLSVPYIQDQFEKALNGDEYWQQMAKDNYLSIDTKKPEEFAALFRLSQRPEDKEVSFNYQLNTGYGLTELEDAVTQAVGEKATVDVKRFGALTQNVLKDTIEEMKKAKAKEQALSMLSGFGTLGEITNINKSLADSLMNDTGIGGVLSFMGGSNTKQESLEKALQGITGVQNNTTYNWQQWFDQTLKEKYNKEIELGYTSNEAQSNIKIEADFAKDFIEKYLQPRFDTSRSMDEFVEYLDVRQEEQNPFQTQDLVNAVTRIANLRSNEYLDKLKQISDRYFDPDFYFNPTGNKARESDYLNQSQEVNKDWEDAKNGDEYWAQQAYRFGVDVNNKADFARMHFQLKGQGKGYDAAEDILNAGKVSDEIYGKILPELNEEALKQGSIFGQFITPEEFADSVLEGVDPTEEKGWNEVLNKYGLTDFKGSLDELKEYIKESLRTGSAQQIREQIKYLNEKRQRPTQEKLGLTYIERPEDYKNQQATPETELYKVFQSAGYQGSEDEFYETMFPDVDRTEQQLLTKAGGGKGLEFIDLDTSDPFAALGSIEGFFQEDQQPEETDKEKSSSFFSLDYGDDEDTKYKSSSGEKILSEFTSFFKGFS